MITKYIKMVKPFDVVIVFLLIVLSFLPTVIFAVQQTNNDNNNVYAVISINGEEVDRFLLTGNEEHRLITYYPAPGKYNIVEIDGERIRNKEDNSPYQIAVRRDWIQSPGETSLNLPHRLLIEIVTENPEESDIDVMAQ
ncbi:NusG domain II-containing protein [Jeotgalibaca caeni]|uniref:NusG domain II-containing protein n=1 Tax=Jeotgalibaca caeni TaxID=3028623 RepID=UPI00237DEC21|nr:NusG domain II-containing protein [Jeotgalibaca caeni]MDE1549669.1 NusG domain II-containing protein [Jeotgalibaca caeni]